MATEKKVSKKPAKLKHSEIVKPADHSKTKTALARLTTMFENANAGIDRRDKKQANTTELFVLGKLLYTEMESYYGS